ncbi:MAG: tyrosine-type recombinase/integrase [Dermatophilaceae bacterium]
MTRDKTVPGITVWSRGQTWTYQVELDPDPLTGQRNRPSRGGFTSRAEALAEAMAAKRRHDTGRAAHAKRIRVRDFLTEWIDVTEPDLKRTTAAGYRDSIEDYIVPILGDRWLGDITVPVLNAFYRHLHTNGRTRGDANVRMFQYWMANRDERDGVGPTPKAVAKACGTGYHAARQALLRYRRGRTPGDHASGLSAKTVRNVHIVMRRALADAVRWNHLHANPAEHAVVPRIRARGAHERRDDVWTVDELRRWLSVALEDRYGGLWCLAATTGMRRSELAGIERRMIDLDRAVLHIADTRVSVNGRAEASDGKSRAGERSIALDSFTVAQLSRFLSQLDQEREAFEGSYPEHPYVMVGPEGRPLHPDTITARFNRLVDRAGVRPIRLHDVRHTYATLAMDHGQNVKTLSERIGHADTSITLKVYTHRSHVESQRGFADDMGQLIAGLLDPAEGALATDLATSGDPRVAGEPSGVDDDADEADRRA